METLTGRVLRAPLRAVSCLLSCWVLSLALASVAAAQPALPVLTAPVNDFAKVIDAASERELERRILVLQKATGDVVVVATVPTFQPYATIEEYAVKLFENAGKGIGQKGKDNGLLILVAVEDRKVRMEVGYGLEQYVTDGYAGQTIRELILPAFKAGRYGEGLVAGATRIINRIAEQQGVSLENVPPSAPVVTERQRRGGRNNLPGLVFIVLFLLFLMLSNRRRRRSRHWGGGPWSGWSSGVGPFGTGSGGFGGGFGGFGGGGGGFGGFGGGRSGGGGASGGW
jgi:uncharacterized protein